MTQSPEDVFASPAPAKTIQRVATRMRERDIEVVVVEDGDQVRSFAAWACSSPEVDGKSNRVVHLKTLSFND
ncbi:MAG: hypothetical protein ACLQUY_08620 [Ktedonobacterales bacterium]